MTSSKKKFEVGQSLQGFEIEMTVERINAYAKASGDFNPVHIDPEYAKNTQFGGVIAHGMLSLAFVSELMAINFPDTWHKCGTMKVRFRAPVFPGETVTVSGEVTAVKETELGTVVQCDVFCKKPDGKDALTGSINVPLT